MAFNLTLGEMIANLNERLAPSGFTLVQKPVDQAREEIYDLTHPDWIAKCACREFLNLGHRATSDHIASVKMARNMNTILVEKDFQTLISLRAYKPEVLVDALMEQGKHAMERIQGFLDGLNPLHLQLLELQEAIEQAGFRLDFNSFGSIPVTTRDLKREKYGRRETLRLSLKDDGVLTVRDYSTEFDNPVLLALFLQHNS